MINKIIKKNILALVSSILIILALLYVWHNLKPKKEDILLSNVKDMQTNIEGLKSGINDIRNVEKGLIKKKIEEATKSHFKEDETFLNEIIELKKKKMIAELKRDIELLASPELGKAKLPEIKDIPIVKSTIPDKTASEFIKVFAINYLKKKAVIFVNNVKRVANEGDNIEGFTLLRISDNFIVMRKEGVPDETIYLGYDEPKSPVLPHGKQ